MTWKIITTEYAVHLVFKNIRLKVLKLIKITQIKSTKNTVINLTVKNFIIKELPNSAFCDSLQSSI